jgi:hypothetical protein
MMFSYGVFGWAIQAERSRPNYLTTERLTVTRRE